MKQNLNVWGHSLENALDTELRQPLVEQGDRAAVADPYWFLARQWQLGEFLGSNGGSPLAIEVFYNTLALTRAGEVEANAPAEKRRTPLQALIEARDHRLDDEAPAALGRPDQLLTADIDEEHLIAPDPEWDKERMEYRVVLAAGDAADRPIISAVEHKGDVLDWGAFELRDPGKKGAWPEPEMVESLPVHVTYRGMPKSRFWEFEDRRVSFASMGGDGNILEALLQEFGLLYSNDWYIVPIPQQMNTLRRIETIWVRDVFGERTEIHAVETANPFDFQQFALSFAPPDGQPAEIPKPASSRYFLLPDAAASLHRGEPLEKVVFYRDETANLVWAIEQVVRGEPVTEVERPSEVADPSPAEKGTDRPRKYHPLQLPPRNYVPFLPVRMSKDGQMKLRRARTLMDPFERQYRTAIVGDALALFEEEIPSQPIAVTQRAQLACLTQDSEGAVPFEYYLWIGRAKSASAKVEDSRLRFDQLE